MILTILVSSLDKYSGKIGLKIVIIKKSSRTAQKQIKSIKIGKLDHALYGI